MHQSSSGKKSSERENSQNLIEFIFLSHGTISKLLIDGWLESGKGLVAG
jgi:hypothetical protein